MTLPLAYRPARSEDLERCDQLVVASINELTERHGFGPMVTATPQRLQRFSLNDDPDGLWVAENSDQIVGFAFSWVCGDLWFLAQLFVAPGQQGCGIGKELLQRTLTHGKRAGAQTRALITFTFNRVSQGLYIRHGLFPRLPIYFFKVASRNILGSFEATGLGAEPLEESVSHLEQLAQIDAQALGVSREKHHCYLIQDHTVRGFLLHAKGGCMGYAYVGADGHIGPLAVKQPAYLGAAFSSALERASAAAEQVSAFLPGVAEAALLCAVSHGMRITFPMVLVSNHDFGDWTSYLPRNPGLM